VSNFVVFYVMLADQTLV